MKMKMKMKMKMGEGYAGIGLLVLLLLVGADLGKTQSFHEDCSVELYDRIFKASLGQVKTPYALVQFFSSWLPACQEYKSHFELVACLFNAPRPVHEGEVFVTKVDCAIESNKGLCDRFNVQGYPTMYWGPPEILASGGASSQAKLGLDSVDGGNVSTAEDLLDWINQRINKQYSLTDRRPDALSNEEIATTKLPSADAPGLWQPDGKLFYLPVVRDKMPGTLLDVEEATAHAFSYMKDEKMMRSSSRGSFIQFIHLLSRHHPSRRCREGSVIVLRNLKAWWPLRQPPASALREHQLCGPGLPRGFWETCDGGGRGYNCGLWMLLHSLTVQVKDSEGSFTVSAISAFVKDFYQCDQCRDHFLNVPSRNSVDAALTKKDVVLWLWRSHNKVTEVVAQEEYKVTGNSTRKLWPLEKECPACRDSSDDVLGWDEEAVYYYLIDFYRAFPQDGELGEERLFEMEAVEKSVGMPYWAAGSIAIASCGFGFAKFYLRPFTQKYNLMAQLEMMKEPKSDEKFAPQELLGRLALKKSHCNGSYGSFKRSRSHAGDQWNGWDGFQHFKSQD